MMSCYSGLKKAPSPHSSYDGKTFATAIERNLSFTFHNLWAFSCKPTGNATFLSKLDYHRHRVTELRRCTIIRFYFIVQLALLKKTRYGERSSPLVSEVKRSLCAPIQCILLEHLCSCDLSIPHDLPACLAHCTSAYYSLFR